MSEEHPELVSVHGVDSQLFRHCHHRAIAHIRSQAQSLKSEAESNIAHIARMSNIPPDTMTQAVTAAQKHTKIALHFHPDRPSHGRTVSRALLEDGIYKSQFETGISNGLVGGARDDWERELFGGAYHPSPATVNSGDEEEVLPSYRPKYGALDLLRSADGPAPRFGSCYFLLRPEVSWRSTFTFGGSQDLPKWRGTWDELSPILSAVLEESFVRDSVAGVKGLRPPALVERLLGYGDNKSREIMSRNLDHFIEVQVHGKVRLDRDVDALVADPSFMGSETATHFKSMSAKYGFSLMWHEGSRIHCLDVPLDFRGPTMPSLAKRIARDGLVDAHAIGCAVKSLTADPQAWSDRGTFAEVLQELKLLWHVLVRYGASYTLGR